MQTNSGAEIVVEGDVVTKVHRIGTDPETLAVRLRIAARLDDCLLAPVDTQPQPVGDGRWSTRWPLVDTVPEDPGNLPWAQAAALLAQLHLALDRTEIPHGAAARVQRAVDALPADATAVRRAADTLPEQARQPGSAGRPHTLVHGDFHLGQLGRRLDGRWRLIDVDDLGDGDPAWDLARPAGFWAAGLIPDDDWQAFLDAYREAGGPAVPASGDPWPVLEPFARAAVVQGAAAGTHGEHDETQAELIAACVRICDLGA